MAIQIDPNTGERITNVPQIDPLTGERIAISPQASRPAGLPDGVDLPQLPAHAPVNMQTARGFQSDNPILDRGGILGRTPETGTAGQRLFGDKPVSNSLSVIGSHLKNMIAGPYKAFTAPPQSGAEDAVQTMGPVGSLGLYRMLAQPTIDNFGAAIDAFKSGDGKTGGQRLMDAIPIAGPWARGIENDAQTYGAIPAMLGLGTDIVAPKAAEGLYGGAMKTAGIGMRAAGTTPEALKVASTRALVTGTPGELLNRSLKPPVTMPDFEQSVEASLPKIAAQNPKGVGGFANAAKASKGAEQQWYQNLKGPFQNDPLDTTPAVNAQMKSIPATNAFETPGIADSTALKASPYDMTPQTKTVTSPILDEFGRPITRTQTIVPTKPTLGMVDDIRQDTNAKLQGLYEKSAGDRYAALSNPETARLKAVNDSTRDLVYGHLADRAGIPEADIRANQTLYGHLSDVADVAGKRATVAGRANPLSLQESLQLHGNPLSQAYNFGTSRLFKGLTNSDALTNAAIDRFKSPGALQLPPRNTFVGRGLYDIGNAATGASNINPFFAPSIASKGANKKKGLYGQN